jgi:hypothetical protein
MPKKTHFTTSPIMLLQVFLKYHDMIINSMQTMYSMGNINITDSRNTFGRYENGIE